MKENLLKQVARRLFFHPGSVRTIWFGPLRGMVFRCGSITGLSAWYSGPERDHQRAFRRLVNPGDTVIDIGANWGLHTLYLSRLVGKSGRVVAMEPFPSALAELQWHVVANHCQNVEVLAMAASDREGKAMFMPGENGYTGSLEWNPVNQVSQQRAITVTTQTLDQVVETLALERVRLVKIDVEGAEGRALAGAEAVVARFHPHFVIDLHTPEQDVVVARWLTARGYRLERLDGPPILRTDVGWPDPAGVWGCIAALPI